MIKIKSEKELENLRIAGRIVALTHQEIKKHISPGVSTAELDEICEKFIRSQKATPSFKGLYGFPASVCISINNVVVHGIPSKKTILKDGDIVTIDIGACYNGYHGDSAWTYPVGKINESVEKLLRVTENSLYEGLKMAISGNRIGDISYAVQRYAESYGYSVVREFTGHGVGSEVHEDPNVPNYGNPHTGPLLKPNMVIAVEPMINMGRKEIVILPDNWTTKTRDGSLSAHFEHTVAITPNGACEILTTLEEGNEWLNKTL